MYKRTALFFLTLATFVCHAQSLPHGTTMHRMQAGQLDESGWTQASSTKGQFSVRLPCMYDDYTIDGSELGSRLKQADMVGCELKDGTKYLVARFHYRNPKADALHYFENMKSGYQGRGSLAVPLNFQGKPAFDFVFQDEPICGFIRAIHAFPENFLLVAEGTGNVCKGLEQLSRTFLNSLTIGKL